MSKPIKLIAAAVLIILVGFLVYLYRRPLPPPKFTPAVVNYAKTTPINLPWPAQGQAAVAAEGYGLLASHNAGRPVPIASISKIITALAVLQREPLEPGQQGPTITLDDTDLGYFNYYYLHDGSVAQVKSGENITEYQALEAMLLPSANNMADSLARWAFGSVDDYIKYANQMVAQLGLADTKVGGASGFADDTTSTAEDLVKLGQAAVQNPVLAGIVSQRSAAIPVGGPVQNINWLLGTDGVNGIKTGNTDKAGGCYLFSARHKVEGVNLTIIGAILGAPQLNDALTDARQILNAIDSGFATVKVLPAGKVAGYYDTAWGAKVPVKTTRNINLLGWRGRQATVQGELGQLASAPAGTLAGILAAQTGGQSTSSPLVLSQALPAPSWHWRLVHK